jgi:hypothetical protein
MKKKIVMLLAALTLGTQVQAHEVTYAGSLLGSSEVPASGSSGSGSATVIIDLDLVTMRVVLDFAGLTGNTTASHIHCCTLPGSNVGVASMTPTFTDFPLGITFGSYDHTFDLAVASSYNPAFITNNGGTVSTALNALLLGLDDGKAYLNIHTTAFGGGEIRALLAPVPLPASAWLLLTGLAGLYWASRRRGLAAA